MVDENQDHIYKTAGEALHFIQDEANAHVAPVTVLWLTRSVEGNQAVQGIGFLAASDTFGHKTGLGRVVTVTPQGVKLKALTDTTATAITTRTGPLTRAEYLILEQAEQLLHALDGGEYSQAADALTDVLFEHCTDCGARLDGDGYDGLCGNCADVKDAKQQA